MRHWIFSCKEISALISESMDRKHPLYKRMCIRFHLMMCVLCRRYRKQLFFIRAILQKNGGGEEPSSQSLPDEARKRIEKKLTTETKE